MKAFLITPFNGGSYNIFDSLDPSLTTTSLKDATCVFFDRNWGDGGYNSEMLDKVVERELPVVVFDTCDYWGATAPFQKSWGSQETIRCYPDWKPDMTTQSNRFLSNALINSRVPVWFMRKMTRSEPYPTFVRQLDLVWWPDCRMPLHSKESFLFRKWDVCFVGNDSNCRANFIASLASDGRLKVDFDFRDHRRRLGHSEWLNRHRQAKMFIEADGGGYGSERPYQLMCVAPMLKQENAQYIHEDFVDGCDCIKIGDTHGHVTSQEIDRVVDLINDNDRLYEMYLSGVKRMDAHFTVAARTKYIVKTLEESGL